MKSQARFRPVIALLAIAAGSTAALCAQQIEPAKEATARLKLLPGSVQQLITVIKGTDFGPFKTSGTCTYDNHWYCFGDCFVFSWSWEFPRYNWLKTDLEGRYNRVRDQASQFDQAFSPVKAWLIVSLPHMSLQMEHVMEVASQTQSAKLIEVMLRQLDSQPKTDSDQLDTSLKTLAAFNEKMNEMLQAANSRDLMEDMIKQDAAQLSNIVSGYPCGADDSRNQYNRVANTVRSQFDKVAQAGQSFGLTSAQTDKDVSLILGTLLATRASIESVLKNLQNATVTPVVALQQLRLNVVAGQWRELSDYARQQLGN